MPKKNTPPADYPQAVLQQIEQLAQNIVIARKRRKETQAQWAQRLGVSQPTMARIERGDPSVAMASYVMCMWLINHAQGLADLIAPQADKTSLEREVARTRTRAPAADRAQAKAALSADHARQHPIQAPGLSAKAALAPAHRHVAQEAIPRFAGPREEPERKPAVRLAKTDQAPAPQKRHSAHGAAAGLAALISGDKNKERP